jgi:Ca2+-dependent lipid-binding protein
MDRRNLPLILMLTAGAVTCIISFVRQYTMLYQLIVLFIVLIIFYILGCIIKSTLDFFERENQKKTSEEGEVIEKGDGTEKSDDTEEG